MLALDCRPAICFDPLDALLASPFLNSRPLKRRLATSPLAPRVVPRLTASVAEAEGAYVVTVHAPGFKADELSIMFGHDDILTVASYTKSAHGSFSFERQFKLPNGDANMATATHEDGVLTITLTKRPAEKAVISVSEAHRVTTETDGEDEASATPYTLTIAAPGVKSSDIVIEASRSTLSIDGETGPFGIHRTYMLPRDADVAAATATHVDGVLNLSLPTKPTPDATAIEITTAPKEAEEETPKDKEMVEAEGVLPAASVSTEATEVVRSTEALQEAPRGEVEAPKEWLTEWDPLLDDMAEMGFEDRESNRAALIKHVGSIKRAVKELVAGRVADA